MRKGRLQEQQGHRTRAHGHMPGLLAGCCTAPLPSFCDVLPGWWEAALCRAWRIHQVLVLTLLVSVVLMLAALMALSPLPTILMLPAHRAVVCQFLPCIDPSRCFCLTLLRWG